MDYRRFVEVMQANSYPGYVWTEDALMSAFYNKYLPRVGYGWHNPDNPEHLPLRMDDAEQFAIELAQEYSAAFKPTDEPVVASNGKKKNGKK